MRAHDPAAALPLERFPLFPFALRSLPCTRTRSLPAGRSFTTTPSEVGDLYVVERGAVVTTRNDPPTTPGCSRCPARIVVAGEVFGQWPAVAREPRSGRSWTQHRDAPAIHVRALAVSGLVRVPVLPLLGADANGSAARWLAVAMAQQANRWERAWLELATQPVAERVASQLSRLAAACGRRVPGGRKIGFFLSQETIAALVATSRESVNRALRELTASGRIRRHGRLYVVSEQAAWPGGTDRPRPVPGAPPSLRARA
jgi:CRP-like cAMP-binding protein